MNIFIRSAQYEFVEMIENRLRQQELIEGSLLDLSEEENKLFLDLCGSGSLVKILRLSRHKEVCDLVELMGYKLTHQDQGGSRIIVARIDKDWLDDLVRYESLRLHVKRLRGDPS